MIPTFPPPHQFRRIRCITTAHEKDSRTHLTSQKKRKGKVCYLNQNWLRKCKRCHRHWAIGPQQNRNPNDDPLFALVVVVVVVVVGLALVLFLVVVVC